MDRICVAIADDEEKVHTSLQAVINRHFKNIQVNYKSFFDTVQLLKHLKYNHGSVDLLFLDHDFGSLGESGTEALPNIRQCAPYLPIILLTGVKEVEVTRRANTYDVDFLQKPPSESEIVNRIDKLIIKIQQRRIQVAQWKKKMDEMKCILQAKGIPLKEEFFMTVSDSVVEPVVTQLCDMLLIMQQEGVDNQKNLYDQIKSDFKYKYQGLDSDTINYIATSEFLYKYRLHQAYDIDYSSIMIGYCKAVEEVLGKIVQTKHKLSTRPTLGVAVNQGKNLFFSLNRGQEIIFSLYDLLRHRNRACHPCCVNLQDIRKVREIVLTKPHILDFLVTQI